jgi:leucyl/phenylalanyl-tRNA--protein transferase
MARRPLHFPDPRRADARGLVAVTERLDVDLLLEAYGRGIFPWSEHPVRWFSPDPRAVFLRDQLILPRKLDKLMRLGDFRVTLDTAFAEVMQACQSEHAHEGVWISGGFLRAYGELHALGFAHSVEVWQGEALVGGLYGIQLGGLFAGESMFHRVDNASKVAFAHLIGQLDVVGTQLIDAQVLNPHTERLGAVEISRDDYLTRLEHVLPLRCRFAGAKWPAEPPAPARRG